MLTKRKRQLKVDVQRAKVAAGLAQVAVLGTVSLAILMVSGVVNEPKQAGDLFAGIYGLLGVSLCLALWGFWR